MWNFSKLDEINSATTESLQDHVGDVVKVTGMTITKRPDENGEVREVMLFRTEEFGVMSTVSSSILRIGEDIMQYCIDEGLDSINMKINQGTSKAGREYLSAHFSV